MIGWIGQSGHLSSFTFFFHFPRRGVHFRATHLESLIGELSSEKDADEATKPHVCSLTPRHSSRQLQKHSAYDMNVME